MKRMGNKKYVPLCAVFDGNILVLTNVNWRSLDNVSISSFKVIGYFDKPSAVEGISSQVDLLFQISEGFNTYSIKGFALGKSILDIEEGESGGYTVWLNNMSDGNDFGIRFESPSYKTAFAGANFHGYVIFDEVAPEASVEVGIDV